MAMVPLWKPQFQGGHSQGYGYMDIHRNTAQQSVSGVVRFWEVLSIIIGQTEIYFMQKWTTHQSERSKLDIGVYQGPLLLTWINFNPSVDK